MAGRKGNQKPTQQTPPKRGKSYGKDAVSLYENSGRKAIPWQKSLITEVMRTNRKGLWIYQKFGYSVPRRNGKNEVIAMREFWGLVNGETMCHTAHRTTTSHSAWVRLCRILTDCGYTELGRPKKGEEPPEKSYKATKQYGLESIRLTEGGEIVFRTRTPNGGLGEGFDLLVIDEAQEYTSAQETALVYTVSDSKNPQTLFCGTPPTATSSGTVFPKMRQSALAGESYSTGWAEWSIPEMTKDIWDAELWYQTNPSMGYHLDERKIAAEIRGDIVDFNIQRLGVWIEYSQKSAISATEWNRCRLERPPALKGKVYIGVKFGHDGANAAVSAAARIEGEENRIYVECLGCRPVRDGTTWIVQLLRQVDAGKVIVDGASGQKILTEGIRDAGLKSPKLPTVKECISANAMFEQGIFSKTLAHGGQSGLSKVASNCEHRPIGSGGGYGYRASSQDDEIAILESTALAYWLCHETKETRVQRVRY